MSWAPDIVELAPAPVAAVPLAEFATHLRAGQGFVGSGDAPELDLYARAASAAVEAMIDKALIRRRFRWSVERWVDRRCAPIPLAPVSDVHGLTLVADDGGWTAVENADWRVVRRGGRAALEGADGGPLPDVPPDGRIEVELTAGFGEDWNGVPEDLRQAVLLLGAHYHEQRHVTADPMRESPFGVRMLTARWRELRL